LLFYEPKPIKIEKIALSIAPLFFICKMNESASYEFGLKPTSAGTFKNSMSNYVTDKNLKI